MLYYLLNIKSMRHLCAFLAIGAISYASAQEHATFLSSSEIFCNPERGFYTQMSTDAADWDTLSEYSLGVYTNFHTPYSASFQTCNTLILRMIVLDGFQDAPLSEAVMGSLNYDFGLARENGVKLILRFAYIDDVLGPNDENPDASFGDAPVDRVLQHIGQLAEVIEQNVDVIATMQLGFIGAYGEGYFTDYFGYAGANGYLTDEDWASRSQVLDSLLAILPEERMIQVRIPQMKQKHIYGAQAPTTSNAMNPDLAYTGVDESRIGFHNDCMFSNWHDYGTYNDLGHSGSQSSLLDTLNLKPYLRDETRFVVYGGETCADGYNPENNCNESDGGQIQSEMEQMHLSYLNSTYNHEVSDDWVEGGCIDEINRRLGYRFELSWASLSYPSGSSDMVELSFEIENVGFAAPFNPRGVEVVLKHAEGSPSYQFPIDADPRFWRAGESNEVTSQLDLSNLPNGEYECFLWLKDPQPSLSEKPEYSIRIASATEDGADVWDNVSGMNRLGVVIAKGPEPCYSDINLDGVVGVDDLLLLLGDFGCESSCVQDLDDDDVVTVSDLLVILGEFGSVCTSSN